MNTIITAQTLTKKFNNINNRYEYFDTRGTMIGYSIYNNLNKQYEYYEVQQRKPYQYRDPATVDLTSVFNAQRVLNNRYNNNHELLQATIDDITYQIKNLNISEPNKKIILDSVSQMIMDNSGLLLQGKINWLYDATRFLIKDTLSKNP